MHYGAGKALSLLQSRLLAGLLLLAVFDAGAADHCVVLQYHHISDETPGVSSVSPELFQRHLDFLLQNNHAVMPLEEVITALKIGIELPEKCVALTIDDAYVSAFTEAYPRVIRYDYPLTVFVSTDAADRGLDTHLSWDQMREMQMHGISFQNHSHSHGHLIRRLDGEEIDDWEQRIAADIQTAQNRIEDELGSSPNLFAYPYGEYNEALKKTVESMGLIGFGQQSGPLWRQADFTALPRFALASIYARMRAFAKKVDSLPLPITGAFPEDPVVPLDEWYPALTLIFDPNVSDTRKLTCYLNGSSKVSYHWLDQPAGAVVINPKGRLNVGRNRVSCTLPIPGEERLAWYSHSWIRRHEDGRWYGESR
jgi:peptidoglycan/xylan/chitin deacetylase (PgdA/CDA1 family)